MIGIPVFFVILIFLLTPTKVLAVCPLCTVAVGAGLGISRALGIDDTITSLWIGGLLISSGLWSADWLTRKKIHIPQVKLVATLLFYILTIPFLYIAKIIGIPGNTLFGIDKVIFGTAFGSVLFLLSVGVDRFLRAHNNGTVVIYYQKVLLPLLFLSLMSFILYLLLG